MLSKKLRLTPSAFQLRQWISQTNSENRNLFHWIAMREININDNESKNENEKIMKYMQNIATKLLPIPATVLEQKDIVKHSISLYYNLFHGIFFFVITHPKFYCKI